MSPQDLGSDKIDGNGSQTAEEVHNTKPNQNNFDTQQGYDLNIVSDKITDNDLYEAGVFNNTQVGQTNGTSINEGNNKKENKNIYAENEINNTQGGSFK